MITLREKVGRSLKEKEKLTRREKLTFFLPIIALTVIGFFIAFQFVDPARQGPFPSLAAHKRAPTVFSPKPTRNSWPGKA